MKIELKYQLDLDIEEDKNKFKELTNDNLINLKYAMNSFSKEVLRKYRKYGGLRKDVKEWEKQNNLNQDIADSTIMFIENKFYKYIKEYEVSLE